MNLRASSIFTVHDNKITFIVVSILIVSLIVDEILIKLLPYSTDTTLSSWRIIVFSFVGIIYMVTPYFILKFIRNKFKAAVLQKELYLGFIVKLATAVQIVLTSLYVAVILQIVVTAQFNNMLLTISTTISYSFAVIMMTLLAQRFFAWFKSNKSMMILAYGISATVMAINAAVSLGLVILLMQTIPSVVVPHVGFNPPIILDGSFIGMFYGPFIASTLAIFLSSWIATALLLRQYSRTIGTLRYWVFLGSLLAYFLSQFFPSTTSLLISLFGQNVTLAAFVSVMTISLSQPVAGILFALGFWAIAKSLAKQNPVRNYLNISGFGFVLFFISNQAFVLTFGSYPPFGLASTSFLGLASFLLLGGIYSSAISVSQDVKLRKEIRKLAVDESKLLDSIGTAHMEQELQSRVLVITKKQEEAMKEETGVQSSLTEEDMKQYLEQVLQEIKRKS